jgi:drug/metabolite transporter (DMT)-like permease
MKWLVLALLAMCLFSVSDVLLKVIVTDISVPKPGISSIASVISRINLKVASFAVLAVALSLIGVYLMLLAMQSGEVALVTAVLSMSTVVVAGLAMIFLGDRFSFREILAIALVIVSILLLVSR